MIDKMETLGTKGIKVNLIHLGSLKKFKGKKITKLEGPLLLPETNFSSQDPLIFSLARLHINNKPTRKSETDVFAML